jgi:hypothetical protein
MSAQDIITYERSTLVNSEKYIGSTSIKQPFPSQSWILWAS